MSRRRPKTKPRATLESNWDELDMGRFETTARTYAAYREPYPETFFVAAAEALRLTGHESLIDLGAGPGLLALGFEPYVGYVVGVDPEPAMIAAARQAAADAGLAVTFIEGRAEDLDQRLGAFDLITIGRALHWMDRERTLAAFDRILRPGGRILICGSRSARGEMNPWRTAYESVLRAWMGGVGDGHRRLYEHWFDGSRFTRVTEIKVGWRQLITLEALIERALTRSTTSPAILGPRIEAFRAELRQALAPSFPAGEGVEFIEAIAQVFAAA
jgi:SAM-dependent methyltransferase